MKPKSILVAALALSGLGDLMGGLGAVLDWRRMAVLMARWVPDWEPQRHAAALGIVDDALRQLWANLGTALIALGAAQIVAALWVRREWLAGYDLARLIGWALVVAGGLMAVVAGQRSSLATEAMRGLILVVLAAWARPAGAAKA